MTWVPSRAELEKYWASWLDHAQQWAEANRKGISIRAIARSWKVSTGRICEDIRLLNFLEAWLKQDSIVSWLVSNDVSRRWLLKECTIWQRVRPLYQFPKGLYQ